jgi:hypothetical protein
VCATGFRPIRPGQSAPSKTGESQYQDRPQDPLPFGKPGANNAVRGTRTGVGSASDRLRRAAGLAVSAAGPASVAIPPSWAGCPASPNRQLWAPSLVVLVWQTVHAGRSSQWVVGEIRPHHRPASSKQCPTALGTVPSVTSEKMNNAEQARRDYLELLDRGRGSARISPEQGSAFCP